MTSSSHLRIWWIEAPFIQRYLSTEPVKKKCYKVPARIVEKYFAGMDPNKVDNIVELALEAWFHKGKDGADV